MFTGIIEAKAIVESVVQRGSNRSFTLHSALSSAFHVDQSISHDGVCLTVESVAGDQYSVTAIQETLLKTNLNHWKPRTEVNLERCLVFNGRLDGHLVQGHVDSTATCLDKKEMSGSWLYRFGFPENFRNLVIEKGSIAVNGISLTCFDVSDDAFSVAIIPYTMEFTNIGEVLPGFLVNIEFDLIGKYVERITNSRNSYSQLQG